MTLNKINEKFIWTYIPNMITKEVIGEVTGLFSTRPFPVLKSIKNEVVMERKGATYDKRALVVNTIRNLVVRNAAMMIGYG